MRHLRRQEGPSFFLKFREMEKPFLPMKEYGKRSDAGGRTIWSSQP
jgi:hypothetical protein